MITQTSMKTHYNETLSIDNINETVTLAGWVSAVRDLGGIIFIELRDKTGFFQVVADPQINPEVHNIFSGIKDEFVIQVTGKITKRPPETYNPDLKTGEIEMYPEKVEILSKAKLLPFELSSDDTKEDIRLKYRYLDIRRPAMVNNLKLRHDIVRAIRDYMNNLDFMEVETPMLVANAGGAAARPFETHYNALDEDVKLRISLELYLKRLIVGGLEKVYEIGRVFRNEGVDTRHNPEFTLMELYQAYTDYYGMMDLTESMFKYLAEKVCGSSVITYNGIEIDFGKPFERITMVDCIKKYAGIDFDEVKTDEEAKALAREKNIEFEERHTKGDIVNLFFEEFCEKNLIQPTFVMDHPLAISPLTKKKPDDPEKVERFELFINTWEMCNAYSELNDPIDQRERFAKQEEAFANGDEEANHTDEDFLNALSIGMPPTGGIGYGIDRLVMLLTDSPAIRDVLLFPTMKSLDSDNKKSAEKAPEVKEEVKEEVIDFSKVEIEPMFKDFVDFDSFSKCDFRAVKVKACEAVKKSKKLLQFTLDDGTGTDRTILSGIHAYYEPEELVGKTLVAITNLPPRAMMGIDSCGMLLSAVHTEDGEEKLHLLMVDNHIPAGAKLY